MIARQAVRRGVALGIAFAVLAFTPAWSGDPGSDGTEEGQPAAVPGEEAAIERAQAALAPFKKNLKETLTTTMQREGPLAAVDACRIAAPAIAADASQDGLRVGRTSTRLRNPANAPADWMTPLLAAFEEAEQHPAPPRVVALEGDRLGYAEPIYAGPLCLACHGADVAPPLRSHIRERYPDDRATGYEAGDLRGMFWVELPAAP